MSYLARSLRPARATFLSGIRPIVSSSFHSSSIRQALSESDHETPDRATKIESNKQDSITKSKSGKGEWKPELASNSEQAVAAEKDGKSMKEMQDEGAKKAEQGNSPSSS